MTVTTGRDPSGFRPGLAEEVCPESASRSSADAVATGLAVTVANAVAVAVATGVAVAVGTGVEVLGGVDVGLDVGLSAMGTVWPTLTDVASQVPSGWTFPVASTEVPIDGRSPVIFVVPVTWMTKP